MELEPEKFKSLEELSKIQQAVHAAGAEFLKIKGSIETVKIERETAVNEAVQTALAASKEAIQEADGNIAALASLLAGILSLTNDMTALRTSFDSLMEEEAASAEHIKTRCDELIELITQTQLGFKNQRREIEDARRVLDAEKEKVNRDRILVEDRKKMLSDEITRIKKLKL